MPQCDPYIFFGGNCADAMRFYERTLGGKLWMMTAAEAPEGQKPPGSGNGIIHARLELEGGGVVMASDDLSGTSFKGMYGFYISLIYPTAEEARRIFDALAAGGQVHMPFGETFYSSGFGMLVDQFGTPWMLNGGMKG
jgi:PhnB protein